jgi:hypothetical protein
MLQLFYKQKTLNFCYIIMSHLQQETVIKSINNSHFYWFSDVLVQGHNLVHIDVLLIIYTIKGRQIRYLVQNKTIE